MKIADKTVVAMDYRLTIDDGIIVDASEKGQPLVYLHGAGNIIPGLERELEGLEPGDKKTVVVAPADGYGERDPSKVHTVRKNQFPEGTTFDLGDHVQAKGTDGQTLPARVVGINPAKVTLDFNHELAGQELTFDVVIDSVREATAEELQHGHVHGPGGHHH